MYLPKTCCLRNLRPASRRARRIDHTRCSAEFWFARSFLARPVISGSRRMSPCSCEADARDNGLNSLLPHVPHPDHLPWWGEGVEVHAPHPDPLPWWGEGVEVHAPHPDPLPWWGEGVEVHVPHPDPLPWWGEGVEVHAPHPDPLPRRGEGDNIARAGHHCWAAVWGGPRDRRSHAGGRAQSRLSRIQN